MEAAVMWGCDGVRWLWAGAGSTGRHGHGRGESRVARGAVGARLGGRVGVGAWCGVEQGRRVWAGAVAGGAGARCGEGVEARMERLAMRSRRREPRRKLHPFPEHQRP